MTLTFPRLAGLAGLAGSLVLAALLLVPVLVPDNDFLQAPFFGGGALLLVVFAAGLYRAGKGRLGMVAKAGLMVALAAFLSIAVLAVLDTFSRLGWGDYEWLWPVLVISAGLMFAGLAVYAAGAMLARAIPAWAGIPLAVGGAMFAALEVAAIVIGDRPLDAMREAVNMAAMVSVVLVTAAVGLLGLMLALGRIPGTDDVPVSSPRSLPKPST
jgi:hypothetical protein